MKNARVLREKWKAGDPAFGAWAALPSAFAAELMCVDGLDYVCVDQQHGMIDYLTMVEMLRAIEGRDVVTLTRVPANEGWMISKALDAGVQGVVVPMVNSGKEAAAAVTACRYPPLGNRSYGPIRSSLVMKSRELPVIGGEVLCFVMVETREAVERIDEIAATPGLDGIYIGPADLALGLGLPPNLDKTEPEHAAAVEAILASCKRHGIIPGIQCGSGRSANKYAKMGFKLVTFAKDSSLISAAMERELGQAQGIENRGPAAHRAGYT
jgi:4-hydroxy-2-oxoheptanedioate aldolase